MKTFALQRRLASDILGVGRNKIWFDPLRLNDIQQALTRSDIDELIKDKAIFSKKKYHKKTRHKRKNKGTARIKKKINFRKRDYMRRIRKIRKYLKNMKEMRLPQRPRKIFQKLKEKEKQLIKNWLLPQ